MFDNDGLLLDTEEAWTRAETTLFARHASVFTEAHKRALLGSSRSTAAGKLEVMLGLAGEGERLMDELHELVMEEALRGVPPRPGALELVDAVRAAGVPVGLASNSSREFVERVLSVAGMLDGHFDLIVTADEVEHPKPAPDLYLAACRGLSADPRAGRGARGLAPRRGCGAGRGHVRDRRPLLCGHAEPRGVAAGRLARRSACGRGARCGRRQPVPPGIARRWPEPEQPSPASRRRAGPLTAPLSTYRSQRPLTRQRTPNRAVRGAAATRPTLIAAVGPARATQTSHQRARPLSAPLSTYRSQRPLTRHEGRIPPCGAPRQPVPPS